MSEKYNYIVVMVEDKDIRPKLDILKNAGIRLYSDDVFDNEKTICFGVSGKHALSSGSPGKDDKVVNSWREFVFEILKYYYCVPETEKEVQFLKDFFKLEDRDSIECFRYSSSVRDYDFYFMSGDYIELPFDGYKLLLESTIEEKNMKNQEKIKIELTPQEIAFLIARTNPSMSGIRLQFDEQGLSFMNEWVSNKGHLFQVLKTALYKKGYLENDYLPDLDLLKPLFNAKIEPFKFSNKLTTEVNGDSIKIGCKAKSSQDWIKYCKQILDLGLDKIEIEGYSFSRSEIDKFVDWIENNFN